jgi:hypothetical protein
MQINLTTSSDTITPELRRIAAGMQNKRPLLAALGKQLEIDLRKHFLARDSEGNKRGFPSMHFWRNKVAKQTALTGITQTTATVSIASPELAHKITGGIITPKRAKALSIAISPEAYKAGSASLFPRPLTQVDRPGRPPLLVETGVIGKSKMWKIHYVLLKSVRHDPDPRALPKRSALDLSLLTRARALVDRIVKK